MITSLYRKLLIQAKLLPDATTSTFFLDKIKTSFRSGQSPEASLDAIKRIKQSEKLLRQLQAANNGYLHAIDRALLHAYGRRGRQKHVALRPFTMSEGASDGPHAFAPALAALVTSPIAHTSNSPNAAALVSPPSLPARAIPLSEEARLLGPLGPQRITKIKLRYWNEQVGKLRAPIAILLRKGSGVEDMSAEERAILLEKAGLLARDNIGSGRLWALEHRIQVSVTAVPNPPRRVQSFEERSAKSSLLHSNAPFFRSSPSLVLPPTSNATKWHLPKRVTPRLMRRRFQNLLYDAPIVTVSLIASKPSRPDLSTAVASTDNSRAAFNVTRSEWAKGGNGLLSSLSAEDLWWIERDVQIDSSDMQKMKKRK